jgi:hypothetical protein
MLEINIKKYPSVVVDPCYVPKFTLDIKNIGKETITHKDLYTKEYKYALYYFIDDTIGVANADRSDYQDVFDTIKKEDLYLI